MLDDEYAEQIGSIEGVVEPMVLTAEVERKELEKTFTQVGIRWRTEGEKDEKRRMERGGRGEVRGGKEAVGEYVWG